MMSTTTWDDVTYEKVASSERNPAFRVPFFAIQEVERILDHRLFYTRIEDDGVQGPFGARGDKAPFIPYIRRVD